jgi:RNA polymerase sigma factor (sigma-70 family)
LILSKKFVFLSTDNHLFKANTHIFNADLVNFYTLVMISLFSKQTDAKLLEALQQEGSDKRKAEYTLYNTYKYFINDAAWKHQLDQDEASICYSDSILTVLDHIALGRFEGNSSLKTYIFQIFSNKCVDHIRKKTTKKAESLKGVSVDELLIPIADDTKGTLAKLLQQEDFDLLKERVAQTGEKCKTILDLWAEGHPDSEVSQLLGYNTAHVLQSSRLRCLQKLRSMYLNKQ